MACESPTWPLPAALCSGMERCSCEPGPPASGGGLFWRTRWVIRLPPSELATLPPVPPLPGPPKYVSPAVCTSCVSQALCGPLCVYGSQGWARGTGRATSWGSAGPGAVTNGGKQTPEGSRHDEWEVLSTGPGARVLHVLCYGQSPTCAPWVSAGPRWCPA